MLRMKKMENQNLYILETRDMDILKIKLDIIKD